jgi:hypothetical protein
VPIPAPPARPAPPDRLIQPGAAVERRFSQPLNLPILHPIRSAIWPVFPGFFGL